MSNSWYKCQGCNNTCSDYDCFWCDCGSIFCDVNCGDIERNEVEDQAGEEELTCKFCRLEDATDEDLLDFALEQLNKTKEELKEMFLNKERSNGL
jgi:hypothetical protein